ncbi:MAG: OmpA family protein [Hyphomicrobiaceae bacterium]|nr:OmpA family protein [Hyphomicrobiaceae bacterium]
MKCNPLRWLWGIIPIAVLSGIATIAIREGVQDELTRRVEARFKDADLAWAKADFNGRDLTIFGKAEADEEPGQAAKIADALYGVRVVDVKADLLQRVSPFTWSAAATDEKLTLGGHVPTQKVRKQVLAAAKSAFPKAQIDDKMELARGNPALAEWQPAYGFALKQLAMLRSGRATLSDLTLSLEGEAKNTASYKDVKSALSSGFKGMKLGTDKVTPPLIEPYTWAAKLAGNQVLLSGFVPSEAVRSDIVAVAQKAFGKTPVVDRMELGSGAPKDWVKAFPVAIDQLATLQDGVAELKGDQLTLTGNALDDGIAEATRKAFKAKTPNAFKTAEAIKGLRPAIPLINPYVTRLDATAGGIEVGGYVPSDAARDAVIKAVKAKFPGRPVSDRLQLGAGEPDGFDTCLMAGLAGLNRLGTGQVVLKGKSVELTGGTEDEALAMALPGEVRSAAKGACETKVNVRYDDIRKRQAAEADAAKADAAERARKAEEEARRKADDDARRLAALDDAKRKVAEAEKAAKAAAALACERALRSTNATGKIQFERASDVILAPSRPLLRKLVEVAKTCEGSSIEVEGHTDSEGIPERNQPLSERRAKAVLDFLVDAGVPTERIKAIGYGDTKPIADNATADGRAQNRRIEFTVKAN